MVRKSIRKFISSILALTMLCSIFAIGSVTASAAETAVSVTIADVTRRYKDAAYVLELINEYRVGKGLSKYTMDQNYLEAAMVRAAEVSLYASDKSPNGKSGTKCITDATDTGQLVAFDVKSFPSMLDDFEKQNETNSLLLSKSYKAVGIGVVYVCSKKYFCLLISGKTATKVSDSVLSQPDVKLNQTIQALPSLMSNVSMPYKDGHAVYCGSSLQAYLKVVNSTYPSGYVFLAPENAIVTVADPTIFVYQDYRFYAKKPGTTSVSIAIKGTSDIYASCVVKAVAKSFSSCTFSQIPDQTYTGLPIRPSVDIRDANGNLLEYGVDYTLSYSNNVNVGTASVTVTGIGNYAGQSKVLTFRIVNSGGQEDYFNVTASASISNFSLGQTTTITATPVGGSAPITYTFEYQEYGTSAWKKLASSTARTCNFTPASANKYYVKVSAKDYKGATASQTIMLKVSGAFTCTAKLSATSIELGGTVKITAGSTGGISPIQFSYAVQSPSASSWTSIQGYSTSTTASFTPSEAGLHSIMVKAKSSSDSLSVVYLSLNVSGSNLINQSSMSASKIDVGQSVTLTGAAIGGAGNYQYAYYYKPSTSTGYVTVSNYSTATTAKIKPKSSGKYDVLIKVKDKAGNLAKKTFTLTVNTAVVNNSRLSATTVAYGNTVTVTGAASGGNGSYQYAIYYKKATASSYSRARDYSTTATFTFKPAAAVNYNIKVRVKDSLNQLADKEFTLTVTGGLKNNSAVSATSVKAGSTVTVRCSASGGTTPYQYAVYYKRSTATAFSRVSDYSTATTATVKLAGKYTYQIRVKVKDASGNVVSKDFTVTAT